MMEVTVYAIVALFIFFRLYLALGKGANSEKFRGSEKIIDVLEEKNLIEDTFVFVAKENDSKIREVVRLIKIENPDFSTDNFMKGAERAFEVILTAFYEEDVKTLSMLLTKEVLSKFVAEINKRKESGNLYKNMIIAINTKEIINIELIKPDVFITVRFVSEQIKSVSSATREDSEALPKPEIVEDLWKFSRRISSSSSRWLLCDIH